MKTMVTLGALIASAMVALAQDQPTSSTVPVWTPEQATRGTFEFRQRRATPPANQPLPRVGTWQWMEKVTPKDRDLVAPWVVKRMNNFNVIEPPAMLGDFSSTSR